MPALLRPSCCPNCMTALSISYAVAKTASLAWQGWLAVLLGLLVTLALLAVVLVVLLYFVANITWADDSAQAQMAYVGLLGLLALAACLIPAWLGFRYAASSPRIARGQCANCPWTGRVSFKHVFQPGAATEVLYESHVEGVPELDDPIQGRRERQHRRKLRQAREQKVEEGPNPDFDFTGRGPTE